MLRPLVIKELKSNLYSLRFLIALVVVVSTMLFSVHVRVGDYLQSMMDGQANAVAERQSMEGGAWWRFQYNGMHVERPVMPLRVMISGIEQNADPRMKVFDKTRPIIRPAGAVDRNPLATLFAPMDFMFITGVVVSLIVLALGFDAVTREHEDGTLKLLLSFPVPRGTLILAKWVGGVLTLYVPFVVGFLLSAIYLQLSTRISFSGSDWVAFFLIAIASLLYIAWMFSAALLVSTWCRNSATSMVMLLLVWVVLVLVVPNVSPYLSAGMVPAESVQSVSYQGMKTARALQKEETEDLQALEKKYNTQSWWRNRTAQREGIRIQNRTHYRTMYRVRLIADKRDAKIEEQTNISRSLARVSPFSAYAHIVSSLAWTGPEFDRDFTRQLRNYENQLRSSTTAAMNADEPFEADRIPFFMYRPPPVGLRFEKVFLDWVAMMMGITVFFLAAYVRFITREIQ